MHGSGPRPSLSCSWEGISSLISSSFEHVRLTGSSAWTTHAWNTTGRRPTPDALAHLAREERPEIFLFLSNDCGRELAPRLAARLNTGLCADCIRLGIDPQTGLLVQTVPAFGDQIYGRILTPEKRPQMATVRPDATLDGTDDLPEKGSGTPRIRKVPFPGKSVKERVKRLGAKKDPDQDRSMEDARIVVCGGRGIGSEGRFQTLWDLAGLLEARSRGHETGRPRALGRRGADGGSDGPNDRARGPARLRHLRGDPVYGRHTAVPVHRGDQPGPEGVDLLLRRPRHRGGRQTDPARAPPKAPEAPDRAVRQIPGGGLSGGDRKAHQRPGEEVEGPPRAERVRDRGGRPGARGDLPGRGGHRGRPGHGFRLLAAAGSHSSTGSIRRRS